MIRGMLFLTSVLTVVSVSHAEPQWQTHDSIYEAVKSYVAQNINTTAEYEINITPLMDRLNLALCTQPLSVFSTNLMKSGRSTINIRCNTDRKWAIFVSITIIPYDKVVIVAQPLPHGEIANEQYFSFVHKDVSALHGNYLTSLDTILNKQALKTLVTGTIVTAKDFVELKMVKRGDTVVITSDKAGLAIKMSGTALSDGNHNQMIKVKNQNSQRVINATVIDMGVVSVTP